MNAGSSSAEAGNGKKGQYKSNIDSMDEMIGNGEKYEIVYIDGERKKKRKDKKKAKYSEAKAEEPELCGSSSSEDVIVVKKSQIEKYGSLENALKHLDRKKKEESKKKRKKKTLLQDLDASLKKELIDQIISAEKQLGEHLVIDRIEIVENEKEFHTYINKLGQKQHREDASIEKMKPIVEKSKIKKRNKKNSSRPNIIEGNKDKNGFVENENVKNRAVVEKVENFVDEKEDDEPSVADLRLSGAILLPFFLSYMSRLVLPFGGGLFESGVFMLFLPYLAIKVGCELLLGGNITQNEKYDQFIQTSNLLLLCSTVFYPSTVVSSDNVIHFVFACLSTFSYGFAAKAMGILRDVNFQVLDQENDNYDSYSCLNDNNNQAQTHQQTLKNATRIRPNINELDLEKMISFRVRLLLSLALPFPASGMTVSLIPLPFSSFSVFSICLPFWTRLFGMYLLFPNAIGNPAILYKGGGRFTFFSIVGLGLSFLNPFVHLILVLASTGTYLVADFVTIIIAILSWGCIICSFLSFSTQRDKISSTDLINESTHMKKSSNTTSYLTAFAVWLFSLTAVLVSMVVPLLGLMYSMNTHKVATEDILLFLSSEDGLNTIGLFLLAIPPATLGIGALFRGPSTSVFSFIFPYRSRSYRAKAFTLCGWICYFTAVILHINQLVISQHAPYIQYRHDPVLVLIPGFLGWVLMVSSLVLHKPLNHQRKTSSSSQNAKKSNFQALLFEPNALSIKLSRFLSSVLLLVGVLQFIFSLIVEFYITVPGVRLMGIPLVNSMVTAIIFLTHSYVSNIDTKKSPRRLGAYFGWCLFFCSMVFGWGRAMCQFPVMTSPNKRYHIFYQFEPGCRWLEKNHALPIASLLGWVAQIMIGRILIGICMGNQKMFQEETQFLHKNQMQIVENETEENETEENETEIVEPEKNETEVHETEENKTEEHETEENKTEENKTEENETEIVEPEKNETKIVETKFYEIFLEVGKSAVSLFVTVGETIGIFAKLIIKRCNKTIMGFNGKMEVLVKEIDTSQETKRSLYRSRGESLSSFSESQELENSMQEKEEKEGNSIRTVKDEEETIKSTKPVDPVNIEEETIKSTKPVDPVNNKEETIESTKPVDPVNNEEETIKSTKPVDPVNNEEESGEEMSGSEDSSEDEEVVSPPQQEGACENLKKGSELETLIEKVLQTEQDDDFHSSIGLIGVLKQYFPVSKDEYLMKDNLNMDDDDDADFDSLPETRNDDSSEIEPTMVSIATQTESKTTTVDSSTQVESNKTINASTQVESKKTINTSTQMESKKETVKATQTEKSRTVDASCQVPAKVNEQNCKVLYPQNAQEKIIPALVREIAQDDMVLPIHTRSTSNISTTSSTATSRMSPIFKKMANDRDEDDIDSLLSNSEAVMLVSLSAALTSGSDDSDQEDNVVEKVDVPLHEGGEQLLSKIEYVEKLTFEELKTKYPRSYLYSDVIQQTLSENGDNNKN